MSYPSFSFLEVNEPLITNDVETRMQLKPMTDMSEQIQQKEGKGLCLQ